MTFPRYVCIHGHFYQPPRENPWLDVVEVQDSAAPAHDWNERITRECYGPNMRSRLVDSQGQIIHLLNNYAWMSFNFGPTLLSWMADAAPEVLQGIVEADRLSRDRRGGHGNALAQVYNHIIMPLASCTTSGPRCTGGSPTSAIAMAATRKGCGWPRRPSISARSRRWPPPASGSRSWRPSQARRWRPIGADEGVVRPRSRGDRPVAVPISAGSPRAGRIALFFYDGIVSRDVAFERLLDNGELFLDRLLQGFDPGRGHAQLMHIATDGESYGHHHPHGDMALAYVLDRLSRDPEVRLTNYGEFLELHPPEWEVEIHDRSAWSCATASSAGTPTAAAGPGATGTRNGAGRSAAPSTSSRTSSTTCSRTRGREFFPDPWAARDAYIDVILDRSARSVRQFLRRHGHPDLDEPQIQDALRLLEMQRNGMYMYTSCGWFFDEISGLETTQCLHYAARAIHLAKHFGRDCEKRLVHTLKLAPSNLPRFKTGRGVWEQVIQPAVVDLDRVMAHYAISLIFPEREAPSGPIRLTSTSLSKEVHSRGSSHLAIGRLRVRSQQTWEEAETFFAVIHYGGLDFFTALRRDFPPKEFDSLKHRLREAYKRGSLADVTTLVTQRVRGERPPARRPLPGRAAADHRDRAPRPDRGLPADLRAALHPG